MTFGSISTTVAPIDFTGNIQSAIARAQGFAAEAFSIASDALNEMTAVTAQITTPTLNIPTFTGGSIGTIDLSGQPTSPDLTGAIFPPVPFLDQLQDVALPSIGAVPVFTATPNAVNLDIAPPNALTATIPPEPTTLPVTIPSAPSVVLPDVPTLFGIELPAVPTLTFPSFSASLPSGPNVPDTAFTFTEPGYTSALLAALETQLLSWVNGASTGLSPAVEQALWERGRARDAATMVSELDDIRRVQASRGFTQPPGSAAILALQAIQKARDAAATYNREVTIKQAELEQSNRHFAIQNAIQLEGNLINYANAVAQRAFDAAKYTVEAAVAIFAALVSKYNADIQAYIAQATVFKTLLEAELAKLEIFKAQIEGQKLVAQINVQLVEIYKARIDGAKAVIDIFKAQVDAARAQAEVNKTIIEAFAVEVQAYDSQVKAKASEYDGYATRIKAEVAKLEAFKVEADAYSAQVNGFAAGVKAQTDVASLEVKIKQEVPLERYKATIQAFQGQVQAVSEQIKALAEVFDAQVRAYASGIQGQSAGVNAQADALKAEAQVYSSVTQATIELFKGQLEAQIERVKVLIEGIRGAAQVAAQLAAGAMAGISISEGVHAQSSSSTSFSHNDSNTYSSSESTSDSKSTSDIHTYKEK
jgi:hypothetical protein